MQKFRLPKMNQGLAQLLATLRLLGMGRLSKEIVILQFSKLSKYSSAERNN